MSESNKFSVLDTGVMLVLFPALLYFFTYIYETGYLMVYDIPPYFINVEVLTIINLIPILAPKILLIFLGWNVLAQIVDIETLKDPVNNQIYQIGKVCSLSFIIALFSYEIKSSLIVAAQATIGLYLFYFLFPLITRRKVKGYRNKLLVQINEDSRTDIESLKWYQIRKMGHTNVKAIAYIVVISIAMLQAGVTEAKLKNEYYKFDNKIVIRIYDGIIICCEYDKEKKEINNSKFEVVELSSSENIVFEKVEIQGIKTEEFPSD